MKYKRMPSLLTWSQWKSLFFACFFLCVHCAFFAQWSWKKKFIGEWKFRSKLCIKRKTAETWNIHQNVGNSVPQGTTNVESDICCSFCKILSANFWNFANSKWSSYTGHRMRNRCSDKNSYDFFELEDFHKIPTELVWLKSEHVYHNAF